MNLKKSKNRAGFSLMEILLAAAIVAILALITIPVINRQIAKTDEYAYYMAYKTVEKMAGQIAAAGDPSEIPSTTTSYNRNSNSFLAHLNNRIKSNPISKFTSTLGYKFANTQAFILSKFMTKTNASDDIYITKNETYTEWKGNIDSDDYDDVWIRYNVCYLNKNNIVKRTLTTTTESGEETVEYVYYKKEDFNCDENFDFDSYLIQAFEIPETTPNGTVIWTQTTNTDGAVLRALQESFKNSLYPVSSPLSSNSGIDNPDFKKYCKENLHKILGSTVNVFELETGLSANTFFSQSYNTSTGYTINDKIMYPGIAFIKDTAADSGVGCTANDICSSGQTPNHDDCYNSIEECLAENEEEEGEIEYSASEEPGLCQWGLFYQYQVRIDTSDISFTPDRPTYTADWCTDNGYFNMTNNGTPSPDDPETFLDINCECKSGYEQSLNDDRVCVLKCVNSSGTRTGNPYAMLDSEGNPTGVGKCCTTDFNPKTGNCCQEKSFYNKIEEKCECISGYDDDVAPGVCELKFCPPGYYKTPDNVCVLNPPIIKADRFCERIKSNWNTASSQCDRATVFTESDGYAVNTDVYEAASSNSGTYLSIDSKHEAFNSIEPNIILSNGLKLWILGDKAASIPGISYYNATISETQNMCKKIDLGSTNTKTACKEAGGYFCGADNVCLGVSAPSTVLPDARNCCNAPDLTTIQAAAQVSGENWKEDVRAYAIPGFTVFVDINGNRGSGTLWEDVYPFYISSDGIVYPGYPLDGVKSVGTNNSLYTGGNSEKMLPTDVYYYKDNATNTGRDKIVAFSGVSYARAACSARLVSKYSPYCLNLGENFSGGDPLPNIEYEDDGTTVKIDRSSSPNLVGRTDLTKPSYIQVDDETSKNPCDKYRCFIAVRKKLKSF